MFVKYVFLNKVYLIFSFSVTKCIYINTEYWPEHSFKLVFMFILFLLNQVEKIYPRFLMVDFFSVIDSFEYTSILNLYYFLVYVLL